MRSDSVGVVAVDIPPSAEAVSVLAVRVAKSATPSAEATAANAVAAADDESVEYEPSQMARRMEVSAALPGHIM